MAQDPWAQFRVSPAQTQPAPQETVVRQVRDPRDEARKQAAEARAQQDQAMQERKFQLDQQKFQIDQQRNQQQDALGTESERTAGFLAGRIVDAVKRLAPAAKKNPSAQAPTAGVEMVRGIAGDTAANYFTDAERQQVYAAQRDILDAALTLGTGAAYTPVQLKGYETSYLPQLFDDPQTIKSKRQALRTLLQEASRKAGRSAPDIEAAITALDQLPDITAGDQQPDGLTGSVTDETGLDGNKLLGGPGGGPNGPNDPNAIPIAPDIRNRANSMEQMAAGDQSGWRGLATMGEQGITLNLSDEAAGVGGFLSSLIRGEDPRAGYIAARDARQATVDQAKQAWGGVGTAMEFLGGGAGARMLAAPNSLLQAAKQGAALGGAAGFGSGRGAEGSAVNALAGSVLGAGLGAGFQAAGNALASRAARSAPDMAVVEAGQRQGIPVRQPDARPELRGQMAQAETSQTAGPMIREARAADANAIEQRVAEIGGQGNPSDPYALGSRVQEAGQRYIAKTKQQATRLYDRAKQLAGNSTVTPRNADATLDANIQELRAAGENSNGAAIKYLEGLRSDIDRGLSLESVQNLRTNMRGQISQQGLTGTDTERRVAQVIDAMNQDLTEQLPKEAGQALNAADAFYKQRQEFINGTLKQFMGNRGNPLPAETAAQRLVSMAQGKGNFERFSNMWKQLEPTEQADVAATIAASLGRKANGEFSIATLIRSLDPAKGINPRTARTVFGEDGAKALQDLRIIAAAKTETGQALNNSRTGVMVNQATGGLKTLLWGAVGMMGGGPGGAAAGAVSRNLFAAWGEQRAAKMLLNPDFTKWLRNAPNTANPQAIDRYFGRLASIRGIASNDNQAFQQAIMQAFRASPTSAAAQDEANGRRKPPQQ